MCPHCDLSSLLIKVSPDIIQCHQGTLSVETWQENKSGNKSSI